MRIALNKNSLKSFITSLVIFLIFFSSCKNTSQDSLTNVTGKSGEIIVIIDKNAWNLEPGEELRKILTATQPALPQEEPMFKLFHLPPSSFSDFFKTSRNIIYIKSDNPKESITIQTKNDVWAKPQAYMEISAPDNNSLTDLIKNNKSKILDFFIIAERKRLQDTYTTFQETGINKQLAVHHLSLTIPKGYKFDKDTLGFVWITSENPNTSQGIYIYEYNYNDTNVFTAEKILAKRDSVLKRFAPGHLPETWMTTEHDYPTVTNEVSINNVSVFELRSLWKIQNDFMGGPFLSISFVDKSRNKVITIEGYVYAPKSDKLSYIKQMEAILYSFKLI